MILFITAAVKTSNPTIDVLFQNLPTEGVKEIMKTLRIIFAVAEIQTDHPPNTSVQSYCLSHVARWR
jgi:hypothetical protein